MPSPGVTFNLTFGKGVTELQNLTNLHLSFFAENHQMQQKNVDVSPKHIDIRSHIEFMKHNQSSCSNIKIMSCLITYSGSEYMESEDSQLRDCDVR